MDKVSSVELVWITPDAEQLIGRIARVSNPANEDNPEVERLLRYLIKHKHWSPFEMASMCVEIKTTRAIAAQILRHRSFSFQEFSQRYAVAWQACLPEIRRQDKKNRQNSIDDFDPKVVETIQKQIGSHFFASQDLYQHLLSVGVAKECARAVLPMNTVTRLYMSGTIRSWLHYADLRSSNGTQAEHQDIAFGIRNILNMEIPTIYKAMFGPMYKNEKDKILEAIRAVEHLGNAQLNESLYKQLEELESKKSTDKKKSD